jgi:predicted nucleotidyltransferase
MTLEEVIARFAERETVDGIIIVGSASENKLSSASDFDLVIVLAEMPAPLHVGLTYIDQRLADIIFFTVAEVDQVLSLAEPVDAEEWVGWLIRWLQVGRIAFDRTGRLQRAQRKVLAGQWLSPASESRIYQAWFRINYNVKHNRRMLTSDDPVYQQALDMRLLYSIAELFVGYFDLRRLLWEGEKAAIRYLAANDREYLDLFQRCLTETDRARKAQLYEQLAALTTAPVGGLWPDGATAINFKPEARLQPDMLEAALQFWESLVTG